MGDYKLPELPSDDELGITDDDRKRLEGELPGTRPEMSKEEMSSLLGEIFTPKGDAGGAGDGGGQARKAKKREPAKAGAGGTGGSGATAGGAGGGTGGSGAAPGGTAAAGAAPGAPRSRWKGPVTLVLLMAAAWFASSRTGLPRPVPANAPDTEFSSARAMSMLVEIASDAHPTGSPEHARVRGYLVDRLRSMGLEPEVQTATSMIQRAGVARAATIRNVVARLPGTGSTGAILLTAHYDSRGISRGAGDDGSGVVTILEAVRALGAGEPIRNDVIVLFADAEELGLLGARAFVAEHPWMQDVSLVLSFEMRGAGGPSIMFETKDQNGWIVRAFDAFADRPVAYSLTSEVYERLPNDTDFTPFKGAGVQGLNFAAIGRPHVYHQAYDAPANVSEATIQHHGMHALGALRYLGAAELGAVDAPNTVYFTVPVLGLLAYPQLWVLVMAGALLLLLAATVVLARRRGARVSGLLMGLGVAVLVGALSFGAALALMGWLPRFHPEYGSLPAGAFHSEGWYVIALLGVVFALVTGIHATARRWLSPAELLLGALLLPVLTAVVLAVAMPLAAPNLQWPALAALIAAMAFALFGPRLRATAGWAVAVLLAVPVLIFMVPLTELLWVAMSFEVAGLLAVLMTTALYLCLAALDDLRHPNGWWAPLTGLVVGGAALGMGILSARPSAERPAPSTLLYAYEHGTGAAMWITAPSDGAPAEEARAWALERAGSAFESTRDLSGFAYLAGEVPVATAPVVSAVPPNVTVRSDTIMGGTRHVTLAVRSEIGAEMMRFQVEGGDTRLVSLNGKAVTSPDSLEWADHWGMPDSAVMLELEMPAAAPIDLFVIEHLLRPEELLGAGSFARPPDLAPDVTRLSDRAMFRFSVAAFADPRYGLIRRPAVGPTPVGTPPDTAAVPPDTGGLLPDTATVRPDTGGIPRDTATARPDSAAAQPDAAGVQPDTATARPGTREVSCCAPW